jgi:hypothetical protein
MSEADSLLESVLEGLQANDAVLEEAHLRGDAVAVAASSFPGALRTFESGSLAHLTVIRPVTDADCGVVLDRRSYPDLGPDGDGVGCRDVVAEMADHLADELEADWPGAAVATPGKRAIVVTFDLAVGEDNEDPSVDLIVGLTRRPGASGLWIPNLKTNAWDPSDPEKHTSMFTAGSPALRRVRRRAVRLAKGWARQYRPAPLCSFNLEALAHHAVVEPTDLASALQSVFRYGATSLADAETADPASVSDPIHCDDRGRAVDLLTQAADGLDRAIAAGDDAEAAYDALAAVYFRYLEGKTAFAEVLRIGEALTIGAALGAAAAVVAPTIVKAVRSFR